MIGPPLTVRTNRQPQHGFPDPELCFEIFRIAKVVLPFFCRRLSGACAVIGKQILTAAGAYLVASVAMVRVDVRYDDLAHGRAQLGYGACNFHPGPPHYPGWALGYFAFYNQAPEVGRTLTLLRTP